MTPPIDPKPLVFATVAEALAFQRVIASAEFGPSPSVLQFVMLRVADEIERLSSSTTGATR